jgi:AcrR family transcriptional regulator
MTTYHHGDLRAAVLAAAGRMLEKEGAAGLSVRAAARRAGVSHAAPYRHFPDRDALLAALAQQGFRDLEKALEDRSGRELGEAYVAFALERPERFRLMFAGRGPAPDLQARFAEAFGAIGPAAALAGAAAWSLVHGLALLMLDGRFETDAERVRQVLGAVRFAQRSA